MKKILGLDLGTNSIGWALINHDFESKSGNIQGMGSRIVPMSQDVLSKFDSGQSVSQTADRTNYRSVRKLYQRHILRRERMHRVLMRLGFLPDNYAEQIDFEQHPGQFKPGCEPKINYTKNSEGKYEFLFQESFQEMLAEFKEKGYDKNIPYDWLIYFLRTKALNQKIGKAELAWILLNFNQKRGYYQLRGDEAEEGENNKNKEFCALKVKELQDSGEKVKDNTLYKVIFENGWEYDKPIVKTQDWEGKTKEFIVTTTTKANGEIKRSYKAVDSEKDWPAIKAKTEQDLELSGKTVGAYIYTELLTHPKQKIRGKFIRTIERKYYRKELEEILACQIKHHPELQDPAKLKACIVELYPNNSAKQSELQGKSFIELFSRDIIFYQRPLKTKRSTRAGCPFEYHLYKKKAPSAINPEIIEEREVKEPVKVVAKSNPLYQEFRLWQFLENLRFYNDSSGVSQNVTESLLPGIPEKLELYHFLSQRREVEQKHLLNYFVKHGLIEKTNIGDYRWNYVADKTYPCCETNYLLAQYLVKAGIANGLEGVSGEEAIQLWHIIYSVSDKTEYRKALGRFAKKIGTGADTFIAAFDKFPPFAKDYGAYSLKAIKKLLPLMRLGSHWSAKAIDLTTTQRIQAILDDKENENISSQVLEKTFSFSKIEDFQGLPLWLASYVVYNRHSELSEETNWESPEDISNFLREFKQHTLRNPIVEQVVTETLRTVRDIWQHYGKGKKGFFDEIHLELGREMKNPAKKRANMAAKNTENENTNNRIKEILEELMADHSVQGDIRPYSPSHQEILKLYEEGVYLNPNAKYSAMSEDDVAKLRRTPSPSKSDIKKYKLWLEQGYCSPYTGKLIPLSELFTPKYEIEHVIPRSRYFDDSLSNKVICESAVNKLKDNSTAMEFINDKGGSIIDLEGGKQCEVLSPELYKEHCSTFFRKNGTKCEKLLTEDIPENFIARQMNDSRYISKYIKYLLGKLVREEGEQEGTPKRLLPLAGAITSKLKNNWGLNDKWNALVAPRFERLNQITNSSHFGYWDKAINAFRCQVPAEHERGFNKKRIDHRHHALDALVIACTSRNHLHYLNTLQNEKEAYALREKLLQKDKHGNYKRDFLPPWGSFTTEAAEKLANIIVSFKQNNRVINKTNNKTLHWTEENGRKIKKLKKQHKGDNWAIRKPLHKETVYGSVSIQTQKEVSFANGIKNWEHLCDKVLRALIKGLVANDMGQKEIARYFKDFPYKIDGKPVAKVKIFTLTKNATASRLALNEKFTRKNLNAITDSGIRKILENHLKNYTDTQGKEDFASAFSQHGLDTLNANIKELNGGKAHQPIYKVRVYEEGNRIPVSISGNKSKKYVEAAKGTNLYFAVYWDQEKNTRTYETVPLNEAIEHQKQVAGLPANERTPVPINKEKGTFLFVLSPNDLVYVPSREEQENPGMVDFNNLNKEQVGRVYKMVSGNGRQCFFILSNVAISIVNKMEYSSANKMEKSVDGSMIKEVCWKLKVDRLGNVVNVER